MAVWTMAFVIGRPTAATVNGVVADLSSPRVALFLGVVVCLGAAALARSSTKNRPRRGDHLARDDWRDKGDDREPATNPLNDQQPRQEERP